MILLIAGCGGSTAEKPREDTSFVGEVVSNVSDARNDPEKLKQLFTPEALPDKKWVEEAQGKDFSASRISINGDEATVEIEIENDYAEPLGTATWTCVRDGESWKISAAPICQ